MRFDLFTTLDPVMLQKLRALPFARWWTRLLHPRTCFVGTTVSEYTLLPPSIPPEAFARHLVDEVAPQYPLLIVKDLPTDAVLVGDAAHRYSRRLAEACCEGGFELVEGQALAYIPLDFDSIEDFLARMPRSRRKDIKRKLKGSSALDIEAHPTGDVIFNDEELLAAFYELYLNVYRQSQIHFDLLSRDFFKTLLRDSSAHGVVFVYRAHGVVIGYNICFIENEALVDKYVGFLYPQAREHDLYTVSWFHNLQYARARRLRCYIAGWTDPEIKRHLGASFTLTQHAVYARNPLLRRILRSSKRYFETDRSWHAAHVSRADS
jgi:predicted N-acyltransferase